MSGCLPAPAAGHDGADFFRINGDLSAVRFQARRAMLLNFDYGSPFALQLASPQTNAVQQSHSRRPLFDPGTAGNGGPGPGRIRRPLTAQVLASGVRASVPIKFCARFSGFDAHYCSDVPWDSCHGTAIFDTGAHTRSEHATLP